MNDNQHPQLNILIAESDQQLADGLAEILSDHGHRVYLAQHEATSEIASKGKGFDLLLIDPFFQLNNRPIWTRVAQWRISGRTHLIVFCEPSVLPVAGQQIDGVYVDFLPKPFQIPELLARVPWVGRCAALFNEPETVDTAGQDESTGTPRPPTGSFVADRQLRELGAELANGGSGRRLCRWITKEAVDTLNCAWAGIWVMKTRTPDPDPAAESPQADTRQLKMDAVYGISRTTAQACEFREPLRSAFSAWSRNRTDRDAPAEPPTFQAASPDVEEALRRIAIIPLQTDDRYFGFIVVGTGSQWDTSRQSILDAYAHIASLCLSHSELRRQVCEQSLTSTLTTNELDHLLALQKAMTHQFQDIRLELEARTEEAEAANRAKSAFFASMSHELRTPLNSILGFAQTLERKLERGQIDDLPTYTQRILTSGRHLLVLIDDLLNWSRFQADGIELRLAPVDFANLVEQALDHLSAQLEERNLRFSFDADDDLPTVQGDSLRLVQVLINLLSNSVKFTPPGGSIGITARHAHRTVTVTAWDTGCGIPEDQRQRIFELFRRVDPTELSSGWGLGLAVTKEIIDLHQGRIWAEENIPQGTRIHFTLPTHQPATQSPASVLH